MIPKDGGVGEGHPLMNRDQLIAADSIWSHPSPAPTAFYLEERLRRGTWTRKKKSRPYDPLDTI